MKFDLSQFKKTGETSTHATFEHPHGHQIHIIKKALNPALSKQLGKVPMHLADGGMASSEPSDADVVSQLEASNSEDPVTTPEPPSIAQQAGQGIGNILGQTVRDVSGGLGYLAKPIVGFGKGLMGGIAPAQASVPLGAETGHINGGLSDGQIEEAQQNPIDQYSQNQLNALREQSAGAQEEQKSLGELGVNQASALYHAGQHLQEVQDTFNTKNKEIDDMKNSVLHDMKNFHINPNDYVEHMSTPQKVTTAIGLVLGGLGGALTGQENPALKFLNSQIERNIDSQKANFGKQKTLLEAAYHQFGNMRDAQDFNRLVENQKMSNDFQKSAAAAQDPLSKARAMQASGIFHGQAATIQQQMAIRHSIMNGNGGSQMDAPSKIRLMNMSGMMSDKDKDQAYKEAQKAMEVEKLRADFQSSFDDLNSRFMGGALSPADRQSAIQAFAGPIAKVAEGRFNLEEAKNQADALLPGKLEGSNTRALKQARLNQFFDSFRAEPTLNAYQISIPRSNIAKSNPNAVGYRNARSSKR